MAQFLDFVGATLGLLGSHDLACLVHSEPSHLGRLVAERAVDLVELREISARSILGHRVILVHHSTTTPIIMFPYPFVEFGGSFYKLAS